MTYIRKLLGVKNLKNLPGSKFIIDNTFKNFTKEELSESIENVTNKRLKVQLILIYYERYNDYDKYKIKDSVKIKCIHTKRNKILYAIIRGYIFYLEELFDDDINLKQEIVNSHIRSFILASTTRSIYRFFNDSRINFGDFKLFQHDGTSEEKQINLINNMRRLSYGHENYDSFEITEETILFIFKFISVKTKINLITIRINNENVDIFKKLFNQDFFVKIVTNLTDNFIHIMVTEIIKDDYRNIWYKNLLDAGKYEILKILLTKYNFVRPKLNCIINIYDVKKLIGCVDCTVNTISEQIFCALCEKGLLEEAKEFKDEYNVKENCKGWAAFVKAAQNGHLDVCEWLYSFGKFRVEEKDYMLLINCCILKKINIVEWILSISNPPKNILKLIDDEHPTLNIFGIKYKLGIKNHHHPHIYNHHH